MTTKPRDEADKDAARPAEQPAKATDTEKAATEAAKVAAKRNEIDAQFREDVRKAAEKRDKALEKFGPRHGGNIAEIAWNETKADEDPKYGDAAADHRRKLDTVVQAVRASGNADVVGLEAFEERVKELLADEAEAAGTPSKTPATAKAIAEKGKE